MTNIEQLIEKHKGERTYFDHELIGAYFTVQNLENLVNDVMESQENKQEPEAWILNGTNLVWSIYPDYADVEPLYTRPTKPLSDDEIVKELERTDEYTGKSFFAGVRWAEKAHGIGND